MKYSLKNVSVVTNEGIIKTDIVIENDKIVSLKPNSELKGFLFDEEVTVVPGFIDQHIHGVNGADTMDATIEALENMASTLPKEGTTSFLPTTMTQSDEAIKKALQNVKKFMKNNNINGAEVIGIHLEGPFINEKASGAQPRDYIVNPSVEKFKEYQEISENIIKIVTVAPEVEGGLELIKYLNEQKIIASIGHTKATYDEALQAIKHGASMVTHCYNAMTPIHHRDLGVVGAVYLHDKLHAEIIVDGVHVHEKAVYLLYKNKGVNHITLVTDSLRAKWLPDGEYDLGGQMVKVVNNQARLEDGTLAGSTLKMIDAFKNSIKFLNLSLLDAVKMASTNPARNLGISDRKGSIEIGKDADLLVLDKNYDIIMTVARGKIVYEIGEKKWRLES